MIELTDTGSVALWKSVRPETRRLGFKRTAKKGPKASLLWHTASWVGLEWFITNSQAHHGRSSSLQEMGQRRWTTFKSQQCPWKIDIIIIIIVDRAVFWHAAQHKSPLNIDITDTHTLAAVEAMQGTSQEQLGIQSLDSCSRTLRHLTLGEPGIELRQCGPPESK